MKSPGLNSPNPRQVTVADIPRVGPGTPADEWFRKYWLVAATDSDLRDIPLRVKILWY